MGIKSERQAQAAAFVSMRNLLNRLAVAEGTTISEVAGYLLGKLRNDGAPQFLWCDGLSLTYAVSDPETLDSMLRQVAASGTYEGERDDPEGLAFENHGWLRSEMKAFLREAGIRPPDCCSETWTPKPERPRWLQAYAARKTITIDEAASMLISADPEEDGVPSELGRDFRRWHKALCDAVDSDRISASEWAVDRGEQRLNHADIKEWARRSGAPWPFLDDVAPTLESPEGRAILDELAGAKTRIRELEEELNAQRKAANASPDPTRLMRLVIDVQNRYWGNNWDPNDPDTRTPQKRITEWLCTEHSLTGAEANAVERVACPFNRDPGKKRVSEN